MKHYLTFVGTIYKFNRGGVYMENTVNDIELLEEDVLYLLDNEEELNDFLENIL